MTLLLALALLGLVLIDDDLLALNLSQNLALNLSTCYDGSTNLGLFTIANEQNLFKSNRFICLSVELLYEDNVALLNTVLLATGLNDCVHALHLLYKNLAGIGLHLHAFKAGPVRLTQELYPIFGTVSTIQS